MSDSILSGTQFIPLRKQYLTAKPIRRRYDSCLNVLIYLSASPLYSALETKIFDCMSTRFGTSQFCFRLMNNFSDATNEFPNPIEAYQWADLVIGSCGLSFWERSAMSVPSILYCLTPNQQLVFDYIRNKRLAFFLSLVLILTFRAWPIFCLIFLLIALC